jgi:demethylmenaquinone methyltransferase/2-methoxy-6-polyprenyl-1,4-benzoquinol methylase
MEVVKEKNKILSEVHSSKPETIKNMFSEIAPTYDKANSVLSLGIHKIWKSKLVYLTKPRAGHKVLDCATGTGDIAFMYEKHVGPAGEVMGTDFCQPMLDQAVQRALDKKSAVSFKWADVMSLNFQAKTFDIATISFGIRNVQDPFLALKELARVVKPNGVVAILEFGQIRVPIIGHIYNFYSEKVLPKIGGLVSGKKSAYEYLQKSSAQFPSGKSFRALMRKTDCFSEVKIYPVNFGLAYIYVGKVK